MKVEVKDLAAGAYAELVRTESGWNVCIDGAEALPVAHTSQFATLGRDRYKLLGLGDGTARVIRFADLHRHSDCSLLDGMTKIKDMVQATEYAGALTDHGVMYGFLEYYSQMKAADKKPIIGMEAYQESIDGALERCHLILLAKSEKGVKNLFKLTSESYEHFKRKPHVTWEMLEQYHDDIICTTACLGGLVPKLLKRNDYHGAKAAIERFLSIFGQDDFYIELQRHGISGEQEINAQLIALARKYGVKLIAATDAHYPTKDDAFKHEVLMCISTHKAINDPKRIRYEGSGYYLLNSEEMEELFSDLPEALDNTLELAEKCNIELNLGDVNLPQYSIPAEYPTPMAYLRAITEKGFCDRFDGMDHKDDPVYRERLEYELAMIERMGFASYFIVVWDFINYAREHGVYVGPGRGSAAGSLAAYCMGITDMDPIKYKLLFERFLNPERISWPDIDTDIEYYRRAEVIHYMIQKYGAENVCRIVTFGTLAAKAAVKDVGRVLGVPASYTNRLSAMIPKTVGMTINKALEESAEFQMAYENDAKAKEIIDIARRLEGNKRHASVHACFDADTLVATRNGFVRIADVETGMEVLTHNGRYKPVVDTITTDTDKVFHVKIYNAPAISVTGNHPLLVRHQYTTKAKSKRGNKTRVRAYTDAQWKTVENLCKDDYIGIPVNQTEVLPHSEYNLPYEKPEFWWIIGRYIGDGWTESYRRTEDYTERRIIICCGVRNTRKNPQDIIDRLIACGFGYRMEERKTVYKIFIKAPKALYDYLQTFGRYAHGKQLTGDILNLPQLYAKSFLDGYLSADGSYDESTGTHAFRTVSKILFFGLVQMVNKVYHHGVSCTEKDACIDIIEGRKVQAKRKYTGFFITDNRACQRAFYEDGYIWARFRDISVEQTEQQMYNLTVLDDSSYTANGIAAHNCGLALSPSTVSDFLPTSMEKDEETGEKALTSQVVMTEVEELSLIKMDLLGLKTLGVMHEVIDRAQEVYGKDAILQKIGAKGDAVRYQDIPLTDRATYKMLAKGLTGGVFQLESEGMTHLITDMLSDLDTLPDDRLEECFERLIAAVALYRPGPMDYIPNYIEGMKSPEKVRYDCEQERSILSSTYGVLVYQEQLMQIAQELAGYSLARADILRKACGKKKKALMDAEHTVFIHGNRAAYEAGEETTYIPGCVANGISEQAAEEIWEKMVKFASYAFNRSHAACYAWISYITAYMACHWTELFYAAMCNAFMENSEKMRGYLSQAARRGIEIQSPDVNCSDSVFYAEHGAIRFGLQGIGGMKSEAERIVAERKRGGAFTDLQDLYERCGGKMTRKNAESLAYAGALAPFGSNRAALLAQFSSIEANYKKTAEDRQLQQFSLFNTSDTAIPMPDVPDFPQKTVLKKERSLLGMYVSRHPTEDVLEQMTAPKGYIALDTLSAEETERKAIITVGMVEHLRVFETKTGRRMCVFDLETRFHAIRCVVFTKEYEACAGLLHDGDIVGICGDWMPDSRGEGMQFIVKSILTEETLLTPPDPPIIVSISNKAEQERVLHFIAAHPGDIPVYLEHKGKQFPLKKRVANTIATIEYLSGGFREAVGC